MSALQASMGVLLPPPPVPGQVSVVCAIERLLYRVDALLAGVACGFYAGASVTIDRTSKAPGPGIIATISLLRRALAARVP